jgi:hypothetical protein
LASGDNEQEKNIMLNVTIKPIMLRATSGSSTVVLNLTMDLEFKGSDPDTDQYQEKLAVEKVD